MENQLQKYKTQSSFLHAAKTHVYGVDYINEMLLLLLEEKLLMIMTLVLFGVT